MKKIENPLSSHEELSPEREEHRKGPLDEALASRQVPEKQESDFEIPEGTLMSIFSDILECGANENAEAVSKLTDQVFKLAQLGLSPEELFSLAPRTAISEIQKASRLFIPKDIPDEILARIETHKDSLKEELKILAGAAKKPIIEQDTQNLTLHPAGPALLDYLKKLHKSSQHELWDQTINIFHEELIDGSLNIVSFREKFREMGRLNNLGLLSFEYSVKTLVSMIAVIAEHVYKNILRLALALTQTACGDQVKVPAMLGPLMKACNNLWKDGQGPILLLDNQARSIRNADVHGGVRVDLNKKTVSFADKDGRIVLGPWRRDLWLFYEEFTHRCKAMWTAITLMRWPPPEQVQIEW